MIFFFFKPFFFLINPSLDLDEKLIKTSGGLEAPDPYQTQHTPPHYIIP